MSRQPDAYSAGILWEADSEHSGILRYPPDGFGCGLFSNQLTEPSAVAFTDDAGVPLPLANQRAVPEPSTWTLLTLGFPALLGLSRPRRGAHGA